MFALQYNPCHNTCFEEQLCSLSSSKLQVSLLLQLKTLWTRKYSPRMKNSDDKCDSWIAHILGLNFTNHALVYEELVCNGLKENQIETVKDLQQVQYYKHTKEVYRNAHSVPAKSLFPILKAALDLCLGPALLHTLVQTKEATAVGTSGLFSP